MTDNPQEAVMPQPPQKIDISKYLSASGEMAIWVMKLRQSGRTEAEVDEVIRSNMANTEFSDRKDTLAMQLKLAQIAFTYPKVEGEDEFQRVLNLFIKHVLIGQFAHVKLNYAASDVVAYESEKNNRNRTKLSPEDVTRIEQDLVWMNTMGQIATDYFVKRQQGMAYEAIEMSPEHQAEVESRTGQLSAGLLAQFLKTAYEIEVMNQLPEMLQAFDQYLNHVLVHLDHGAQHMNQATNGASGQTGEANSDPTLH